MDTVEGNGQILDKNIGISRSANTFGKGINPKILSPVMDN